MRYVLFLMLVVMTGCTPISIGNFDLKYGTGSDAWSNQNGQDKVSRPIYYHSKDWH